MRILGSLTTLAVLAAFAIPAGAQASASTIAKYEQKRTSRPKDVGNLRSLGVAYFKNKEFGKAQSVLAEAQQLKPKDGVIALYLGMSAEEQGDLAAARNAYSRYLANGRTKNARDNVSKRLAALSHRELQASAKLAVAQETRLAGQPGSATSIAVMPLTVTGNAEYQPLGRGLADLMISDFGHVAALQLLERDRIQAMLDEIAAGQAGQVEAATAARSGRLLRAGSIVTGSLTISGTANITLAAGAVNVATSQTTAPGDATGTLDAIFDHEKEVVLEVLDGLARAGVTVTDRERNAIRANRPTRNVQAFLAYSRGLAASDAGRLDEAANFFDNARSLDPGFSLATQRGNDARAAQAGATITTTQIETTLRGSAEGQVVNAAESGASTSGSDGLGSTLANSVADVNPSAADGIGRVTTTVSSRDATSSTTGQDLPTVRMGSVTIVIRRP